MTAAHELDTQDDQGGTIVVALSTLMLPGPGGPAPGIGEALDRLASLGRPMILATGESATAGSGRAMPADAGFATTLGLPEDIEVAIVATGAELDGHRQSPDTVRVLWGSVRAAHRALWLVTDRPADVRPAQAAGLRVVLVGPRGSSRLLAGARPDITARDIHDAGRLLLARDVFGAGLEL